MVRSGVRLSERSGASTNSKYGPAALGNWVAPVKARLITEDAERRVLFAKVIESYASNELTMEYIESGTIIEIQDR